MQWPIGGDTTQRRKFLQPQEFFMFVIVVATILFAFIVGTHEKVLANRDAPPPQLRSFVSSRKKSKIRGAGASTFALVDDPFCNSLKEASATGATKNRTMINALVSNSAHFQFLHNMLLSMIRNNISWKPLVLSIGAGVCPMLANETELHGHYICVPYLERLFHQLQRDEPESVEQIDSKLIPHHENATISKNNHSARFHEIDNTFQEWGSVEHKFLINSKLYALRDILSCGADAFIIDTDIAFRKDPRPYFAISGARGDIVAQNDTTTNYELSINSGFMYWKATSENLELIDDIIKVPPFWHIDQSRVNTRMANHSTPHTLLDRNRFPNGGMWLNHRKDLTDAVAFHANYNLGREKKKEMLEDMGLWYLDDKATLG